jgi:flagellar basal-body rod modification protein FlgD
LQLTGLASNEAVGLIGKDVTVRGRFISFDGANPTGFSANLKADAESTEVAILDQAGKPVRTMKLGPKNAGAVTVPWDGRTDSGAKAQPGSYTVQVTATDKAGNPVDVTSDVSGKVVGVSFDKGFPEIILDSGARAPISDLISVRGQTSPTSGAATSTASALAKLAAVQSSIPQISQGVQALIPKI